MSAKHAIVLLALLLATSTVLCAAEFYTPPVVSVPLLRSSPVVDGKVEAEEWRFAAVLSDFVLLGGKGLPALPTTVYIGYDSQAVYVAAKLFDPQPNQLRRAVTEPDGEVWRDDCLELFIDTKGERRTYARLAVNALGTKYDSEGRDAAANFQWDVATSLAPDGWSVEIRLPFAQQTAPQPGDRWILGVARNAVRVSELSTWARHQKSFHELQSFGTLIFGGTPYRVGIDDIGAMWLGDNSAFVSVMPLFQPSTPPTASQASEWVKLNVRVMSRDKRGHFFNSVKKEMPSQIIQIPVPYSVKQDDLSTVTFSLTDHDGVVCWRSGPYPVNVPAVSQALQQAEQDLGEALVAWARLPDGHPKQQTQKLLEHLLEGWRHLGERYQIRDRMTRSELQSLLLQTELMGEQAQMLLGDITGQGP